MSDIDVAFEADPSSEFLKTQRMGKASVANFNKEWRDNAMSGLKATYNGDFEGLRKAVAEGRKFKPTGDYSTDEKAKAFIEAVKIIDGMDINVDKPEDVIARLKKSNPYRDVAVRTGALKSWTEKSGEPTMLETTMPNLSIRQQDPNAGWFSKGLGALQDVLGAPSRLLTAATEEMSPAASALKFDQRLARPMEYSTGGEKFFDALLPSVGSSGIIKGVGKGVGKIAAPFKQPSGYKNVTSFLKGIGDVTQPSKLTQIADGTVKGVREGLTTGALPAGITATQTSVEPDAMSQGAGELLLGGLMGGFTGGAGGLIKSFTTAPKTPYTKSLTSGYESLKQAKQAIGDAPTSGSIEGVDQLAKIGEAAKQVRNKIGDSRDNALSVLDEYPMVQSGEKDVYPFWGETIVEDVESRINKLGLTYDEEVLYKNELDNTYTALIETGSPHELTAQITRLNRAANRTTDPSKKHVYE